MPRNKVSFRTSKPSKRLNFLADMIETEYKFLYSQMSVTSCIVAIGNRISANGTLQDHDDVTDKRYKRGYVSQPKYFSRKFGVTFCEANNLWCSMFERIKNFPGEGVFANLSTGGWTVDDAVLVLRTLANNYASEGK